MSEVTGKVRVVVVGNGMVGHHFVEQLTKQSIDTEITVLSAEPRLAYDRVHLSEYFSGKNPEDLALTTPQHYQELGVHFETSARWMR